MNLLNHLLAFYKEDPTDPFNIYSLAIEYQKTDIESAKHYFQLLLSNHSDYLPTYYQAGKLYQELEEWDRSEQIFVDGMALASAQGNIKTYEELKRALRMLQDEREE